MNLTQLLEEYGLETDDVRWALSLRKAESLREVLDSGGIGALASEVWSGGLGDALYDMEERWMRDTEDRLSRGMLDEGHLRDELAGMRAARTERYG